MAAANVLSRSMHGLELSAKESGLPTYRPSPDYDMVMKQRAMQSQAIMSEAYNHQQTVRELQNGAPPPNRLIYVRDTSACIVLGVVFSYLYIFRVMLFPYIHLCI